MKQFRTNLHIILVLGVFYFTLGTINIYSQTAEVTTSPAVTEGQGAVSPGLTLADCYRLALTQSETIAIKEEMVKEAQARFMQYINKSLPQVSFQYSEKIQNGGGDSNFTLSNIPEHRFIFSQSVFSGFREIARIAASRFEKKQRVQEELRARQILFTDVSDAFYFFLGYQENIETLSVIRDALIERTAELKKREEIGRSRPSEMASAEARLSRIEADLESARSDFEVAGQLMEFLIGQPVHQVLDTPSQDDIRPVVDDYYPKAETRPDVLAAQEAVNGAKKQVVVAKGGFSPSVNLEGDYYTKRVGNASAVDWDASLVVDVPISNVGENFNLVKEANAKEKQDELMLQQAKRNARLEIQNAYTRWQSTQRRFAALQKALAAGEKNYRLQKEDFQFNLVNNLTVLQALEDLQDVRRQYVSAKIDARRSYWNFKVAIGEVLQ